MTFNEQQTIDKVSVTFLVFTHIVHVCLGMGIRMGILFVWRDYVIFFAYHIRVYVFIYCGKKNNARIIVCSSKYGNHYGFIKFNLNRTYLIA